MALDLQIKLLFLRSLWTMQVHHPTVWLPATVQLRLSKAGNLYGSVYADMFVTDIHFIVMQLKALLLSSTCLVILLTLACYYLLL